VFQRGVEFRFERSERCLPSHTRASQDLDRVARRMGRIDGGRSCTCDGMRVDGGHVR
jgi:hypothetical protein